MDWIEVTISTNTEGADIVSEALMRQGAVGTQIIDRSDVPDPDKPNGYWELIDRKMLDEMPEDVQVKAWFSTVEELRGLKNCLDALPELTGMDLGTLKISQAGVHEQDWAECWKQYYKPFRAGEHLVIKPSWEAWDEQPGDLVIELDPGMAFGTGTLDPMAVRVAQENVEKNGLADRVTICEGDLVKGLDNVQCEFAVANILAEVIMLLAAPLKSHLTENATFVCSGILREREDEVTKVLTANGYQLFDRMEKGDWVALAARVR